MRDINAHPLSGGPSHRFRLLRIDWDPVRSLPCDLLARADVRSKAFDPKQGNPRKVSVSKESQYR